MNRDKGRVFFLKNRGFTLFNYLTQCDIFFMDFLNLRRNIPNEGYV